MNTALNLQYRDASNYKAAIRVVIAGAINQCQINTIQSKLEDGQFIIAQQIGLPTPALKLAKEFNFPTEDDHVFTTLEDFEGPITTPQMLHTDEETTLDLSVDHLCKTIANVKWDIGAEIARLDIPL